MQNETRLESIRNNNLNALRLMVEDRINYYAAKRIMDLVISFILLVLLSPVMFFTAIVIFIYSPGPIFFKQERVGARRHSRDGRFFWKKVNFHCYKFRTMKINADPSVHQAYIKALIENDEAQMTALQGAPTQPRKLVNDSRIILPGKFLRKLSLDELPQLWNVLIGDMSLIGPRPAIPYEVEMYKHWHLRRLEAQPGITGLQQVTARCTTDFDQQVSLDIEYIDNQSLWLDMKIILKTPLAIISTKGAY
ncbi:MAG: sugar transferase [Anaerolineales bacterium]|nr:sugar transferase [Anaerolineales bacterium]